MTRLRRSSTTRSRGAACVEMALVSPLFIMLLIGILETARLGMVAQVLEAAARDACRVAVLNGSTQSDVQARVTQSLAGTGIPMGTVTPTPTTWASSAAGQPITVTLSVSFRQVSWLGSSGLYPNVTITGSATLSSERP